MSITQQAPPEADGSVSPELAVICQPVSEGPDVRLALDPSHSLRSFWCVAAVFLVVMMGTVLPSPLFGLYEQKLHISSFSVTAIYGIYSVGVVAALLYLRHFGSALGLRTRLASGVVLSALSAGIFLATNSLELLIAARVCSGLAAGLVSGSATSAMIDLGGKARRARSAVIAVGVSFGALALGSAMTGFISDLGSDSLKLPYWFGLLLVLAVTPAIAGVPNGSRLRSATKNPSAKTDLGSVELDAADRGAAVSKTRRRFVQASIPGAVGFAANGLFAAIAAVFLVHYLGINDRAYIGSIVAILFLATAVGQLVVRRTTGRFGPIIGSAGLVVGIATLATTLVVPNLPGLIVAAIIIGASAGICTGAGLVMLAVAVPEEQLTKVTSAYFIALYGSIAVPVIGYGVISQSTGIVTSGLIVCAFLAVAVLGVLISLLRGNKRPQVNAVKQLRTVSM
jgi:MFS family permease